MRELVEKMSKNSKYPVTVVSVFLERLQDPKVCEFLTKYNSDLGTLMEELNEYRRHETMVPVNAVNGKAPTTESLDLLLDRSWNISRANGEKEHSFESFVYILMENNELEDESAGIALLNSGFNDEQFMYDYSAGLTATRSMIDQVCVNLNKLAEDGKIDPVIGREDEVLRTIEILAKKKKNNVVLLGKAGVGKTAIAEALALAIVENKIPKQIEKAVIYNLEVASMVQGTSYRGQFEEKMMKLIEEFKAKEAEGEFPILFIDELHSIVGSGNNNGLDFANIIKPALSRGELRVIGATTDQEWNKFITSDKALKRRFSPVDICEPTRNQTVEILKGLKKHYEGKHEVKYSEKALIKAVDLSIEFMPEQALPDKALDLLDLTGSIHKLKGESKIDELQVEYSLSRFKGVSLDLIRSKRESVEFQPMGPKIKQQVFGQDNAVDTIVKTVEKSLAGLQESNKPIGAFLLVGSTGVGKTELAKQIAKEMGAHLERIDMSEYMEQHSVSKLIGAPPGYVGYDSQGRLTKTLNAHSRCVLLLDEIEKAHPKVLDIWLQAMDNAKVTDSQGEEIRFNNTLILFTSNAGAQEATRRKMGVNIESDTKVNLAMIENDFRPEFRNRLNGIVYFNALTRDLTVNIVKKTVDRLVLEKLSLKGIKLTLTSEAEQWLAEKGYDPLMGARPVERTVSKEITEVLTESILYGEIKAGKKSVTVSVKDGRLHFAYKK